jgi:hypothetical protein
MDPKQFRRIRFVIDPDAPVVDRGRATDRALLAAVRLLEKHMDPEIDPRPPRDENDRAWCHVDAVGPDEWVNRQGYAADPEEGCADCAQKFSCLPRVVELRKEGVKLPGTPTSIEADREVEAFVRGILPKAALLRRMRTRRTMLAANLEIPPDLLSTWEPLLTPPRPSAGPRPEDAEAPEELEEFAETVARDRDDTATRHPVGDMTEKALLDIRAVRRPDHIEYYAKIGWRSFDIQQTGDGWGWWARHTFAKSEAPESEDFFGTYEACLRDLVAMLDDLVPQGVRVKSYEPPPAPKRVSMKGLMNGQPGRPPRLPDSWPRTRDGRTYPEPRTLSPGDMRDSLRKLGPKIGTDVALAPGMRLVRTRGGTGDVVVTFREDGYEVTLPEAPKRQAGIQTKTARFTSLSSALAWILGRFKGGGAYFHLRRQRSSSLYAADGTLLDSRTKWEAA